VMVPGCDGYGGFLSNVSSNAFLLILLVRWDRLCAAILWRNGRVGFSFLVCTISKNALVNALGLFT
jgi:hypothetical protein